MTKHVGLRSAICALLSNSSTTTKKVVRVIKKTAKDTIMGTDSERVSAKQAVNGFYCPKCMRTLAGH